MIQSLAILSKGV
ncbi:hypothetical protein LINPERHAP2_LOCUS31158 [Linum perenne]